MCVCVCVCVCACVHPYLSDYALDTRQRQTLVVGFNNPLQQVVTEHLKHHTHIWVGESRSYIIIPLSITHAHTNTSTNAHSWTLIRIRMPLTPEILKSSISWTTMSLFGSLGSLSLTWRMRGWKKMSEHDRKKWQKMRDRRCCIPTKIIGGKKSGQKEE